MRAEMLRVIVVFLVLELFAVVLLRDRSMQLAK